MAKYLALILPAFLFAACNKQESTDTEQSVPADTQAPVGNSVPADDTAASAANDMSTQPAANTSTKSEDTSKADNTSATK
ncbi:MAG: hypothetical protein DI619_03460 [Francisella sp.]|jgi:lipoprotein|nr:MAG: hypothetical protein DI619_03460 [Francisella sp.]